MNKKTLIKKIDEVFDNPLVLRGLVSDMLDDDTPNNKRLFPEENFKQYLNEGAVKDEIFLPRVMYQLYKRYNLVDFDANPGNSMVKAYINIPDIITNDPRIITVFISGHISTNIVKVTNNPISKYEYEPLIIDDIIKTWYGVSTEILMLTCFYNYLRPLWAESYFDGFYLNPNKTRILLKNDAGLNIMEIKSNTIVIDGDNQEQTETLKDWAEKFNNELGAGSIYYKPKKIKIIK